MHTRMLLLSPILRYMHAHMHLRAHARTHPCTHVHTHMCSPMITLTRACALMHMRMHMHVHTDAYTQRTHVPMYMCARARVDGCRLRLPAEAAPLVAGVGVRMGSDAR